MIDERFWGSLTYIRLTENLGGAGGFDRGMRLAHERGHDWVWCLDSDALPTEGALENLLCANFPSERPIVAKTCLFRDPRTGRISPGGRSDIRRGGSRGRWDGKVLPINFATLCCLLVRTSAAQQAGFIRTDLFIYFDEDFFSYEIRKLGEIIQVGTVIVNHGGAGGKITSPRYGRERMLVEAYWRIYYRYRNQFLFEKHCHGFWRAAAWLTYSVLRALAGIILFDDHKLYRIGLMTRAYFDGLLGRSGKRVDPRDFQFRHSSRPPTHGACEDIIEEPGND
jgi:GT2 family glycosyltransferase